MYDLDIRVNKTRKQIGRCLKECRQVLSGKNYHYKSLIVVCGERTFNWIPGVRPHCISLFFKNVTVCRTKSPLNCWIAEKRGGGYFFPVFVIQIYPLYLIFFIYCQKKKKIHLQFLKLIRIRLFCLPEHRPVRIHVFDIRGREIYARGMQTAYIPGGYRVEPWMEV